MIRTSLAAAAAAFVLLAGTAVFAMPAQAGQWKAIAENGRGIGEGWGWSEEAARTAALDDCENKTGRSCKDGDSNVTDASVPTSWTVLAVDCNGDYYVAGWMPDGDAEYQAENLAASRIGYYDLTYCDIKDEL